MWSCTAPRVEKTAGITAISADRKTDGCCLGAGVMACSFVKKYYSILSTTPSQDLYKFYKEESSFAHGEGKLLSYFYFSHGRISISHAPLGLHFGHSGMVIEWGERPSRLSTR